VVFGLEFPSISHILEWPTIGPDWLGFNKIALINVLAVVLTLGIFLVAGRQRSLVPRGVQNVAEASVDFIQNGIVLQTIGHEGLRYTPFLLSLFFFVFFNNIFEIIPVFQMPATARMAVPAFLGILVWFIYNTVGVMKQGLGGYLRSATMPPGMPLALYPLVVPIEFLSNIIIRPFSLAVRLFANMLAGHLLLVTFAVLTAALWGLSALIVVLPFSFVMLVFLTGFEILVSFLQAYIFTILTAVYIGGAMHPEH
jgi:F-type H+-transporting ATPase subunit a